MTCMNAIDTNVFVYAFDASEPVKQGKARAFIENIFASAEATIVPWQVAVELLARLRKWEVAGMMTAEDVEKRFDEFLNVWSLRLPTPKIFAASFQVRKRHFLSHWDSLLIAACQEAGVERLYSEDMQHGTDYDGVHVENPFA